MTTVEQSSALPLDTDAELAARLTMLSESTRQLLTTLALLRDDRLETLRIASGLAPDVFDDAIDEAAEAGVLIDADARVGFVDSGLERALRAKCRTPASSDARRDRAIASSQRSRLGQSRQPRSPTSSTAPDRTWTPRCSRRTHRPRETRRWRSATGRTRSATTRPSCAIPDLRDEERASLEIRAAIAAYRNLEPPTAIAHAANAVRLGRAVGDLQLWGEGLLMQTRTAYVAGAGAGRFVEPDALHELPRRRGRERAGAARARCTPRCPRWRSSVSASTTRERTRMPPSASPWKSTTTRRSPGWSSQSVSSGSPRSSSRRRRRAFAAPRNGPARAGDLLAEAWPVGRRVARALDPGPPRRGGRDRSDGGPR